MTHLINENYLQLIDLIIKETTANLNKIEDEYRTLKHSQLMEPTVEGWISYTNNLQKLESLRHCLENCLNENKQI